MTEDKVRVKELAVELGVSNKDVLGALRELNIAAKSHMTALSGEEVAKVKARISGDSAGADRKEISSGVIVRRRRRDAEPEKVMEASAPEAGAPVQEPPATVTEKPAPAKTGADPAPRSKTARIIRRPDDVVAEAPKAVAAEKAPEAPAPVVQAEEAPKTEAVAGKAAAPEKQEKPQVRIIRPAALAPNLSAEPERGADGQALSSVPVLAPRSDREEDGAVFSGEGDSEDGRSPRREGQGAPTSQVRVISRPDANAPRPVRDAQNAPRPGGGYRGPGAPGAPRPAGPGGYNRPAGPGGPGGPRPAGPGGYNRPAGPGGPGGPRPAGPGGYNRPAGPGGPGGPRPFTPAGPPGDAGGDMSKKKRQKGRRTVEFAGAGGDDFSRRRKEMDVDDGSWARNRKGKGRKRDMRSSSVTQPLKAAKRKIRVDEFIRVADLAHQMGLKVNEIIKVLFGLGIMATINHALDVDTATLVAAEFDYEVEKFGFSEDSFVEEQIQDDPESMVTRPPVVTIMGHVDHGKTSLLDAIRTSSVVSGEAGGITQHIGAYHVTTPKGEIVFLDTPGHEAFTAMRARGAEVTDIVVLVVAADDGVMEQTREAINHAKAAKVPIMVAVNKMDKEEANPDRVKRELADQGLVPEEWGGDTVFAYVSAKTRAGLDELLELLALQAEILELKANPDKPARGHIVEAKLDKGRGSLGTVLIQQGTLKPGDSFVCGVHFGRVRAMFDDQGKKVKSAGPSIPVEVQGFEGVPEAGEPFVCIPDEKAARRIADTRAMKQREKDLAKESKITLETFLARSPDAVEALVLNLVVKADVQGSLEAITEALHKLSTEKVRLNVIHGGAGAVSESDVLLATASNAIIIGFNVRPTPKAKELAEQEKVDIRFYDIIYKLVEEMKSAMTGMLAPIAKEAYLGQAEVRETFSVPKIGTIAGSHVSDGKLLRNAQVRLLRDSVVIYTGKITSLKRFKDDAREVLKGYECGIGLENYNDIKVGDIIEAFEMIEEAATL